MWAEDKGRQTEPLLRHSDDPNFKGVKEDGRKWNDILFGILFIAMCVGMVSISSFAFSQGNPSSLIPSWEFAEKNITATAEQRSSLWFQDAVAQMKNDRDIIGGGLGLSIVLAALWVQLMKKFTKFFIYFTLIAGLMAVLALGVYTLTVGAHKQSSSIKGLSYGIFGLAGILIIAMIFLRKRIALTCELFKECCLGLQWNPSLFIIVFIIVGAISLFSIYWFLTFVYLYSIPKDTTYQVPHAPPQFETSVRNLMYYQIFGYFWVTSFLSAVFQMTVAGAIATWYFSRDINGYSHNSGSPAFRTLTRAFTKSFGSLAFGSLILATIKFINFILKTAEQKSKAVKNPVASFALKCVRCIFGCVQRLVQFINRFAYIHIAMHGESFCSSARNVFNLMSRNYFDAVFTDLLGEFVLFVGRILGTAACTIFTMGLVHGLGRHLSGMTVTVVAVIAWVIFTIFAHIVGTGVDTVFVCYLEDSERNKENLYVSPDLHKMLKQRSENDRIRQKGNNM